MATGDDVYEGYFIPKGSIVLGNAWYDQVDSPLKGFTPTSTI